MLSWLSFMLSVTYKPLMLSVFLLNVVMLSVIMLNVVMLSVIMLNVVMLSVIMLSVVAALLVLCDFFYKYKISVASNFNYFK